MMESEIQYFNIKYIQKVGQGRKCSDEKILTISGAPTPNIPSFPRKFMVKEFVDFLDFLAGTGDLKRILDPIK